MPGAPQERARSDFRLPAPDRAAAARDAVRVDRDVPDLPAVAGGSSQRFAVDDQPAADTDGAPDEENVVDTASRPATMLRQNGEVGLVRDRDGDVHRQGVRQALAERLVTP